jgi:hypothetical protein
MVTSSGRELYSRIYFRFVLGFLLSLFTVAIAQSQTATYHLHKETSGTRLLLKTANPDSASFSEAFRLIQFPVLAIYHALMHELSNKC